MSTNSGGLKIELAPRYHLRSVYTGYMGDGGRAVGSFGNRTARSCCPPRVEQTDQELETAAHACRSPAYQKAEATTAWRMPDMRHPSDNTAKGALALAEQFQLACRKP
jgi:hypothetical protein